MSWYVLDAVDRAVERTRTCLIEPFDLWKWIKLAIITFFIGGSSGFNGGGNNFGGSGSDFSSMPSGFNGIGSGIHNIFSSFSFSAIIIGAILLAVLFVLMLSIIGSIMEFVFVESLVYNDVHIISYSSKYLGQGLSLFILRILIGLLSLLIFGVLFILGLMVMGLSFADIANIGSADSGAFSVALPLLIMLFIAILFVFMILVSILASFINMAIPVSMYSDCNIFSGLSRVFGQFTRDWKQIVVYWLGRIVLSIVVGIIVAIFAFIAIIILLIVLGLADLILYFIFSAMFSDTISWILLSPILLVEFIFFLLLMALIGMPAKVFMKYHMLTFLQKWYPIDLPVFDMNGRSFTAQNSVSEDW